MEMALSIVAIILAVPALALSLYSVVITKAQQFSTHRIEYVKPSTVQDLREAAQVVGAAPAPFDNMTPFAESESDFDIDEQGI